MSRQDLLSSSAQPLQASTAWTRSHFTYRNWPKTLYNNCTPPGKTQDSHNSPTRKLRGPPSHVPSACQRDPPTGHRAKPGAPNLQAPYRTTHQPHGGEARGKGPGKPRQTNRDRTELPRRLRHRDSRRCHSGSRQAPVRQAQETQQSRASQHPRPRARTGGIAAGISRALPRVIRRAVGRQCQRRHGPSTQATHAATPRPLVSAGRDGWVPSPQEGGGRRAVRRLSRLRQRRRLARGVSTLLRYPAPIEPPTDPTRIRRLGRKNPGHAGRVAGRRGRRPAGSVQAPVCEGLDRVSEPSRALHGTDRGCGAPTSHP